MTGTYVIIKSHPGSGPAMEGKRLARSFGADLILIGAGVALAREEVLGGFCGTVYVADADLEGQGIGRDGLDKCVKVVSGEELRQMMSEGEVLDTF